jgi:hypothetical protein
VTRFCWRRTPRPAAATITGAEGAEVGPSAGYEYQKEIALRCLRSLSDANLEPVLRLRPRVRGAIPPPRHLVTSRGFYGPSRPDARRSSCVARLIAEPPHLSARLIGSSRGSEGGTAVAARAARTRKTRPRHRSWSVPRRRRAGSRGIGSEDSEARSRPRAGRRREPGPSPGPGPRAPGREEPSGFGSRVRARTESRNHRVDSERAKRAREREGERSVVTKRRSTDARTSSGIA